MLSKDELRSATDVLNFDSEVRGGDIEVVEVGRRLLAHIAEQEKRIDEVKETLNSVHSAVVFSSADWGEEKRHAWVYGIIVGWDREGDGEDNGAMDELAKEFKWNTDTVERLRRYRRAVVALTKEDNHAGR